MKKVLYFMTLVVLSTWFSFLIVPIVFPSNLVPQLNPRKTSHKIEPNQIVITFGPINLPTHHTGDLAASLPPHIFTIPEDLYIVGYETELFREDGTPVPNEYLHHLLLIDMEKESLSCPGEMYFIAGSGMEMSKTAFPQGYGLRLAKNSQLMSVVAFYHKTPPTPGVYATFVLHTVPGENKVQSLEAYPVGVNTNCYTRFSDRPTDETEEGIRLSPGRTIRSAAVKFNKEGCVKFAYPHGHNHLVLFTLENATSATTLQRTVPTIKPDGTLVGFTKRPTGTSPLPLNFTINSTDQYEMTMIYHRPLQLNTIGHGMANYILYMTLETCEHSKTNTVNLFP